MVDMTSAQNSWIIIGSSQLHFYAELTERSCSSCVTTFCRTSAVPSSPSPRRISAVTEQIRESDCVHANSVRTHCMARVTKRGYSLLKPVTLRVTRDCRNSNTIPTHTASAVVSDSSINNCSVSL